MNNGVGGYRNQCCEYRSEILPLGCALGIFYHNHLGMGCSTLGKRKWMVSAAGSPDAPPHLLCMLFPAHSAVQSPYQYLGQCPGGDLPQLGNRVNHDIPNSAPLPTVPLAPRWEENGMILHINENCVGLITWHLDSASTITKAQYRGTNQKTVVKMLIMWLTFLFYFQSQVPLEKSCWRSLQPCCLFLQEKKSLSTAEPVRVLAAT